MSFEQKYLKYKSKYLALKAQVNKLHLDSTKQPGQTGGSLYGKKLEELDFLSQTPSMTEELTFKLKGGNFTNKVVDYKRLALLLSDNENVYTTEVSELSQSAGSEPEETESVKSESSTKESVNSESQKVTSEASSQTNTESAQTNSEVASQTNTESASQTNSEVASQTNTESASQTALTDTPVLDNSEQIGGKKAKSHKKYFFDDSDVNLDSTTTDSELSSLDTDTTEDSDADL